MTTRAYRARVATATALLGLFTAGTLALAGPAAASPAPAAPPAGTGQSAAEAEDLVFTPAGCRRFFCI